MEGNCSVKDDIARAILLSKQTHEEEERKRLQKNEEQKHHQLPDSDKFNFLMSEAMGD
jgi:hypothetical protein